MRVFLHMTDGICCFNFQWWILTRVLQIFSTLRTNCRSNACRKTMSSFWICPHRESVAIQQSSAQIGRFFHTGFPFRNFWTHISTLLIYEYISMHHAVQSTPEQFWSLRSINILVALGSIHLCIEQIGLYFGVITVGYQCFARCSYLVVINPSRDLMIPNVSVKMLILSSWKRQNIII